MVYGLIINLWDLPICIYVYATAIAAFTTIIQAFVSDPIVNFCEGKPLTLNITEALVFLIDTGMLRPLNLPILGILIVYFKLKLDLAPLTN